MKVFRNTRMGFLTCFFLLALANCGGGGGGGDDSGGGGVVADFTANCVNGDSCSTNAVTSQKGTAAGNIVEVQLWLNKLNTTIGEASLDLGFDQTVVDYQGFTPGTALGTSGSGTLYVVTEVGPGEVLVDIAPPAGGKSVSSPALIVTLSFKLLKTSGGSNFSFRNPDTPTGTALYTANAPPTIILLSSSKWTGGLFSGM